MNSPNPAEVRRFALRTDDGLALRAESAVPGGDQREPAPGLVVCHPHPLHGGNMFNPVVSTLFNGARRAGVPVVRFNFRGTNGSEGSYDDGVGERLDALAAARWLHSADREAGADGRPIVIAGYSFGADVALSIDHPAIAGWLAVAPPFMSGAADRPAGIDERPTLVLSGTRDQFNTADAAARSVNGWTNTSVTPLPGADHFLATDLNDIERVALDFLASRR